MSSVRKRPAGRAIAAAMLAAGLAMMFGCGQNPAPTAANREEPRGNTTRGPAANRRDLGRDEERGGHTLTRHVARSDEQLRERLARERNISAASTWTDRETAEETVAEALRTERGRVENWVRRGFPRANLALRYRAGQVVGRSLRRGESQTVECTSAVIVLRADGPETYYVLTTYPEARE